MTEEVDVVPTPEFETPDVTKNQKLALGALVGILGIGVNEGGTATLVSLVGAALIALAIVVADAVIRKNRAEHGVERF